MRRDYPLDVDYIRLWTMFTGLPLGWVDGHNDAMGTNGYGSCTFIY